MPFLLFACTSIPDKVKTNKEKFVEVAMQVSKSVDIANLADLYEQTKSSNVEGKMNYLGVDNIQTVYATSGSDEIKLDSIVIFTKSNYRIFYDFAGIQRDISAITRSCGLTDLERISDRLYIGKK